MEQPSKTSRIGNFLRGNLRHATEENEMTCNTPSWWCENGRIVKKCNGCKNSVCTECAKNHRTGGREDLCFRCQVDLKIIEVRGDYRFNLTRSNGTGGLCVQVEHKSEGNDEFSSLHACVVP